MKISGFTFLRNAIQFDFPAVESIKSVLDLVDEFVIRLGDSSDETEQLILSINSPKIKIIRCNWETSKYNKNGMIYAHETDLAMEACTGDWCFYIQGDEVLHEDAIPVIREACEKYLDDKRVDGFLFKYVHMYGDYKHFIDARHFAYPREIRIVRKDSEIHSWRDAQSFRRIPNFDREDYFQEKETYKLNCVLLDAYMFHYGWARDPRCMVKKQAQQLEVYIGAPVEQKEEFYDYGNMSYMPLYKGSQPAIMKERIENMSWEKYLRYDGPRINMKKKFGLKYRIINFIENNFLGEGQRIGGFKNYKLVK
ncbi:MAG: hypothetical protein Q8909_04495 [Bacteroidota bacterium]|nr:hypothetical protein [Bacteroidota bacterium]